MNTIREIIKFGMSYYHFEVSCTGKSGSPDISDTFQVSHRFLKNLCAHLLHSDSVNKCIYLIF